MISESRFEYYLEVLEKFSLDSEADTYFDITAINKKVKREYGKEFEVNLNPVTRPQFEAIFKKYSEKGFILRKKIKTKRNNILVYRTNF